MRRRSRRWRRWATSAGDGDEAGRELRAVTGDADDHPIRLVENQKSIVKSIVCLFIVRKDTVRRLTESIRKAQANIMDDANASSGAAIEHAKAILGTT